MIISSRLLRKLASTIISAFFYNFSVEVLKNSHIVPKEPERKGVFYFGRYGVVAYTSTEEYQNSDGTIARDETKYITKWNPESKEFYITGKEPRTIKIGGYGIGSYDPSEDADKW